MRVTVFFCLHAIGDGAQFFESKRMTARNVVFGRTDQPWARIVARPGWFEDGGGAIDHAEKLYIILSLLARTIDLMARFKPRNRLLKAFRNIGRNFSRARLRLCRRFESELWPRRAHGLIPR